METDPVLSYQSPKVQVSRAAMVLFWLSIALAPAFFLLVPAVVLLAAAIGTRVWLGKRPHIAGVGYAVWATRLNASALFLGAWVWVLMPSHAGHRVLSNRSACAANLRGIMQSFCVYAADNGDAFPMVRYAPYSAALNKAGSSAGTLTQVDAIKNYYGRPYRQAGSVQAILWQLVLNNQVNTKSFICMSDPFVGVSAPTNDVRGAFYDNFQDSDQLSYSMAYPWKADGTVGAWWKNTNDASLPILTDMAPEQGTGTPARYLMPAGAPKDPRTWNSANHEGDGQNVAYADAHADFERRPDVGHDRDNIFTTSAMPSTGPSQFGGVPAGKFSPQLTADKVPFDIVMYPIRNETTGGM